MLERERERIPENPRSFPQINFALPPSSMQLLLNGFVLIIIISSCACPSYYLGVNLGLSSSFRSGFLASPYFPPNQLHRLSANKFGWLECQTGKASVWRADGSSSVFRASQKATNWIRGIIFFPFKFKFFIESRVFWACALNASESSLGLSVGVCCSGVILGHDCWFLVPVGGTSKILLIGLKVFLPIQFSMAFNAMECIKEVVESPIGSRFPHQVVKFAYKRQILVWFILIPSYSSIFPFLLFP